MRNIGRQCHCCKVCHVRLQAHQLPQPPRLYLASQGVTVPVSVYNHGGLT